MPTRMWACHALADPLRWLFDPRRPGRLRRPDLPAIMSVMDDTIATTKTTRPRKRLRLTLGVLMAVVLVLGGGLGYIARRSRGSSDRRWRGDTARCNRGSVRYDWQVIVDGKRVSLPPKGPKWLREAIGADVFDTVTNVGLRADKLDDALMTLVAKLDRVTGMSVMGDLPGIADASTTRRHGTDPALAPPPFTHDPGDGRSDRLPPRCGEHSRDGQDFRQDGPTDRSRHGGHRQDGRAGRTDVRRA